MASIIFTKPGWHRIKATLVTSQGMEAAVRSNRLDVCVPPEGQSACENLPAEDQARTPPPLQKEAEKTPELPIEPIRIPPKELKGPVSAQPNGPEVPPSTSTSSAPPTTPFDGATSPEPPIIHKAKQKRRVAKQPVRVRCPRVHRRHPTRSPHASRKCKIAGAQRFSPSIVADSDGTVVANHDDVPLP